MTDGARVRVREYSPADRDDVLALAPRLTIGMAPWRDQAALLGAVRGWVSSAVDQAARQAEAVYVAVDGVQVVGMVHVAERTHLTGQVDAYVGELITAADRERRGVGRALMQAAEQWAGRRGLDFITLETGAANLGARAFYASLGYLDEDLRLTKRIGADSDDSVS